MKTREEIVKAFEEAVKETEATVATEEVVAKVCSAITAKATNQFGGQGVYVSGLINVDMQGISFRFKRPAVKTREEVFVAIAVDKPERKEEATEEDTSEVTEDVETGSSEPEDRLELMRSIVEGLSDDEYTSTGKPEVSALNESIDDDGVPFNAAERDELWGLITAE